MKLVMTLLVRDEADIIDAHVAFHLNAGVDLVIAMDHRSSDGTTEILESYTELGYVQLIRQDAEQVRQREWVTYMARLAATEHGADWVINSDADEFWWPRARSLEDAFAAVPARYGVVYAPMCYFLPRPGRGPFSEVMTVRLLQPAPINNPLSRYRPSLKAAHRATAKVVVRRGNHEVEGAGRPLTSWHPLELLHFPDRSPEQFARKYANTIASWPTGGREPGAFVLAAQEEIERHGAGRGLRSGSCGGRRGARAGRRWAAALAVDTRLRGGAAPPTVARRGASPRRSSMRSSTWPCRAPSTSTGTRTGRRGARGTLTSSSFSPMGCSTSTSACRRDRSRGGGACGEARADADGARRDRRHPRTARVSPRCRGRPRYRDSTTTRTAWTSDVLESYVEEGTPCLYREWARCMRARGGATWRAC